MCEERTLQGGVEDSGVVGDRVVGLVELVLDKGQGEDEEVGREDRVEGAVEGGGIVEQGAGEEDSAGGLGMGEVGTLLVLVEVEDSGEVLVMVEVVVVEGSSGGELEMALGVEEVGVELGQEEAGNVEEEQVGTEPERVEGEKLAPEMGGEE